MSLRTEEVSKSFGGLKVLDSVTVDVRPSEVHAVVGPNGAGKSTLFNVMGGELRPDGGKVMLDSREITGLPPFRRARLGVGRTFQVSNLFWELTVEESLAVCVAQAEGRGLSLGAAAGDAATSAEVEGLLELFGLAEFRGREATELGHGEQRVLEVALGYAGKPSVLMLDEPTAGMSGAETRQMEAVISSLRANGVAVLLVEHDMELILGLADRVTVLAQGKVIAQGSAREITESEEVQQVYLGSGWQSKKQGAAGG